jgi:hypothetical protein
MREFVAVTHPIFAFNTGALKQQALMFHRIAVPTLSGVLSADHEDTKHIRRNLEWLIEAGIVFEPAQSKVKVSSPDHETTLDLLREDGKRLIEVLFGFHMEELEAARGDATKIAEVQKKIQVDRLNLAFHGAVFEADRLVGHVTSLATNLTRLFSIELREANQLDAYPILPDQSASLETNHRCTKHDVVKIVLAALPLPDDQVSWEQILEYRSDPASQDRFLDLRHWMTEVARGDLTPSEVEEKLGYLLSRYRRHMEVHKMKSNATMFETVVVTSADALGNLASFQWGKAAQALFSLKYMKVDLLEGELTAEGSEVAYILKTRDAFPRIKH